MHFTPYQCTSGTWLLDDQQGSIFPVQSTPNLNSRTWKFQKDVLPCWQRQLPTAAPLDQQVAHLQHHLSKCDPAVLDVISWSPQFPEPPHLGPARPPKTLTKLWKHSCLLCRTRGQNRQAKTKRYHHTTIHDNETWVCTISADSVVSTSEVKQRTNRRTGATSWCWRSCWLGMPIPTFTCSQLTSSCTSLQITHVLYKAKSTI